MAKKNGKKLRAGKSLEPLKSTDIVEYPPIRPYPTNHNEIVLRS